jgi:hypothetical protein
MGEIQQFSFTSGDIRAELVRASVGGDGVDGRALELVQCAHDIDGQIASDGECLEIIADIVKIWAEVSAGERIFKRIADPAASYVGANCLVNYREEPRAYPSSVFIKFGSFDEDTATDEERALDERVFFYCDGLDGFIDLVHGASEEFGILAYELVRGGA